MNRKLHPFPDLEAFGPDDDLVSRKDLAKLLGVQEFTLRNWENAGLMPARASVPAEGILLGLPQVLWRVGDLRAWVPRQVGVVFQRPPRPKGTRRKLEWQAGRGWVEPPSVEQSSPPVRTRPRRSTKIPGQHVVLLGRLEAQLAGLGRLETPEVLDEPRQEPVEEPRRRQAYHEETEPEPFTSNVRRPGTNHARYWG